MPRMQTSISVVIPAYNSAAFIAETIESVLGQTLLPDDILVVDDGSTDNTAEIVARFPPPVRVLTIANCKQGAARNFGIGQVRTEWIAFLDADDLWKPTKLELQVEELSKYPEADICYSRHLRFTKLGEDIIILPDDIEFALPDQLKDVIHRSSVFLPSSAIIRRSALLGVGGFSPDPDVAEDHDLWLRLFHAGYQFAARSEQLSLYRRHSHNDTSDEIKYFEKAGRLAREQVIPYLYSGPRKWIELARSRCKIDALIAWKLHEKGDPRCLAVMTCSMLHWPFGLGRGRGWLQMLKERLVLESKRALR
jgi:glycosyltransferase involved in cell wall biosynthesis